MTHAFDKYIMLLLCFFFFFFNDTATTEIYTLSLHDALPISRPTARRAALGVGVPGVRRPGCAPRPSARPVDAGPAYARARLHRSGAARPGAAGQDRKRGVWGKRVDLGGRRIIKKKK